MAKSSNEIDTERLIEEARAEGRREERWKRIEEARAESKRLIKELDYLSAILRREGR